MSTTSIVPKEWANGPWPILSTPQSQGLDINSHYAIYMATDMCHVHNMFIRAMNSIYLQSPFVDKPKDIADLLFYTATLIKTIEHHHDTEEKYFFPGLATCTKNPNVMAVNEAQHAVFHDGLHKLGEYSLTTSPADYSHTDFKAIIDSFATDLFKHLGDEISTLLALQYVSSKDLKAVHVEVEKHAIEGASFDEMFPLAFGCIDRGFEGGQHKFPPVPGFVKYIVKYWYSRKHQSAWRFNPCDMWGNPRQLLFLPKEKVVE